jgi:Tfp pilus assembly protein FimT
MTFFEVMIVMLLLAIISAIGVSFASSWVRRERMRSSAFVIQTHMQMARVESMSRNRNCRFTIDTSNNEVQVIDLMDPSDNTDDVVITTTLLPVEIEFDRPDAGSAITINNLSGSIYETTFQQDGVVSSGSGDVIIATDDAYKRVSVYVAGGVHMRSWRAGGWAEGS